MENTAAIDSTTKITPEGVTTETSTEKKTENTEKQTTTSTTEASKFETFLKAQLGAKSAGSVSEEELFSAIVGERIESLKGAEASAKYNTSLASNKTLLARADGVFSHEDCAKASLASLREAGDITKEEADKIYSEAFAGAQLDSNTSALFDDRGGAGDATISTAEFAKAMESSKSIMEQIAAGKLTVAARTLDEASNGVSAALGAGPSLTALSGVTGTGEVKKPDGNTFDGQNGFLFKPISENQQSLAVLLPEMYKGMVAGVTLLDQAGVVLDSGTSTGYGEEGTREKFSFNKKGGDYGDNLTVDVSFMDGTHAQYFIPDGSQRYD